MSNGECPVCRKPPLGGQILEAPHPSTDAVTYLVVCPHCGVAYRDREAREQIEEELEANE